MSALRWGVQGSTAPVTGVGSRCGRELGLVPVEFEILGALTQTCAKTGTYCT